MSVLVMSMTQALNSALDIMLGRDPKVLLFGQDIGYYGGVFQVTKGLQQKYGLKRCFDTPISEGGIVAAGIGMAAFGLRPVLEIQFVDYIFPAFDQLVSEAGRLRYRSAGEFSAPITVRAPYGGGVYGSQTHSQSPEALFAHSAGLRTVIPSTPYDAKGLLIAAIECEDPVIFLEPKRIYQGPFEGRGRRLKSWADHPGGQVPEDYYTVPLGRACKIRSGEAVTVLAYGTMIHVAQAAIAESGIDAELIDLRSIVPLDIDAITASVAKTGRCLIVHEAPRFCGFGGELAALVQELCFSGLKRPVLRVTGWDTPYPHAFEWDYLPNPERVMAALRRIMED